MPNTLEQHPAPARREIRTMQEARDVMNCFKSCPPAIKEAAVRLWELRRREQTGQLTAAEVRCAGHSIAANAQGDADRRFRCDAFGRLIALDARVPEQRSEDDVEDDPEADDEPDFNLACRSCGYDAEDSPMSYDEDRDALDIRCARCSRSYSVKAIDASEVSGFRDVAATHQ